MQDVTALIQMLIDQIRLEHLNKVTDKLKDGNSPGCDVVVGYWIKRNNSLRQKTFDIYQKINSNEVEIPEWLVKARTALAAKNRNTHDPKNYRPIACENIMMKVYTGCLDLLIEEHCIENKIIFSEQAGAKKGMWGCADQLLINKTVCEEVKQHCRNLCTVSLDYKKAYHSVHHEWILTALRLAKIPKHLVAAIERLIKS